MKTVSFFTCIHSDWRYSVNRVIILIAYIAAIACIPFSAAYPVAYEASTLHNSVSRSETVTNLFFERWDKIRQKESYLDWYGKINWVNDFKISTVDAAGVKRTIPMELVRTYGSITINYPVIGGYEGADWNERLSGKRKKETAEEEAGTGAFGLWRPKNLIAGFTASGFHYGLTRSEKINRGAAGSETVTDYKYTQFFDDIFALSLLYLPYFYVHGGVIVNNQIEPNSDGTMSYTDSSNLKFRYFMASNLLSFFNLNTTTSQSKLESFELGIEVNKAAALFIHRIHPAVPQLTITAKKLNLFNDEPYDAVWVESAAGKSDTMPDTAKERAALYTLSFLVRENLLNYVFIDLCAELQKPSKTLVDKRTSRELHFAALRETYVSISYNFLGNRANDGYLLCLSGGISRFWDPAIPVHRKKGTGYYLHGGFGSLSLSAPFGGIEAKGIYNYAPELRKLVETADKFAVEGSVYISL